jgi:hypothetical protein
MKSKPPGFPAVFLSFMPFRGGKFPIAPMGLKNAMG